MLCRIGESVDLHEIDNAKMEAALQRLLSRSDAALPLGEGYAQ